jgi:hypothetical protein
MNFGIWDSAVHEDGEQQRRIATAKKADTTPASIDFDNKTALFKGSGKIPYETTLNSCSCGDFAKRKLPCKHIYRLVLELEGADVVQGVNKNEYAEPPEDIYTLPVGCQKMLYDICAALSQDCNNAFIFERDENAVLLLHNGFCVETVLTLEAISALSAAQIKQVLNMAFPCRSDLPSKAAQKKSCVAWLNENYSTAYPLIEKCVIYLEGNEHTKKLKNTIKRRYEKRFKRVVTDYGDDVTSESLEEFFIQE